MQLGAASPPWARDGEASLSPTGPKAPSIGTAPGIGAGPPGPGPLGTSRQVAARAQAKTLVGPR
eukprot:6391509-Pyramimonas_sp.AAC.1